MRRFSSKLEVTTSHLQLLEGQDVKDVKFLVEFINFGLVPPKVLVWEHKIFRINQKSCESCFQVTL